MAFEKHAFEEYSDGCACPKCGAAMTPAEYYEAHIADQSVKTEWEPGKKITTYTTQYDDIQKKIGAVCVKCASAEYRSERNYYCVFTVLTGVLFIAGLTLFLLFMFVPSLKESPNSINWRMVGVAGAVIALFFCLKNLLFCVSYHWKIKFINGKDEPQYLESQLSDALVEELDPSYAPHASGRKLLTLNKMKELKKQNPLL